MQTIKHALIAALALAGSTAFQSANAAQVPFPMDGDLYMGFHSPQATNEYLWNIGQFTQFDGKPVGFQLIVGNISADLNTVFGANWMIDANVQWGSAGTFDATSQVFASKAELVVGMFAVPWSRQSTSSQNFTGSQIDTMAFGDYAGQEATPNNPDAVIHGTGGLSWTSFNNGANSPGGSFGTWVPTIEVPQTVPQGTGIVDTRLDLFRIDPDNTGTNPPAQYIGTFRIDTLGNVIYEVFDTRPPSITQQPRNAKVTVGQSAQFRVTATGAPPLTYQWKKNGAVIPGSAARKAKYKTPPTTRGDNGALFSVVVSNSLGSVTSVNAKLQVKPASTVTASVASVQN
jgi:hypothetical protein